MSHRVSDLTKDARPATVQGRTPQGRLFRSAAIGDRGIVVGSIISTSSGLAQLAIRISDAEIALLSGDWRCIGEIANEQIGHEIEVVESPNSTFGFHAVEVADEWIEGQIEDENADGEVASNGGEI